MPISVTHSIVHMGVQEGRTPGQGRTGQVTYRCDWSDRTTLIGDLLGSVTGDATSGITRSLPDAYPDDTTMYATPNISVTGFGMMRKSGSFVTYDKADISVQYAQPQFQVDFNGGTEFATQDNPLNVPWTITRCEGSVELLKAPGSVYKFDDNTASTIDIAKRITHQIWSFRRLYMPYVPISLLDTLVGRTNIDEWFGFEAESLLFLNYNVTRTQYTNDAPTYELEYVIDWRSQNWNKVLHPTPGVGWDYVYETLSNGFDLGKLYEEVDFRALP